MTGAGGPQPERHQSTHTGKEEPKPTTCSALVKGDLYQVTLYILIARRLPHLYKCTHNPLRSGLPTSNPVYRNTPRKPQPLLVIPHRHVLLNRLLTIRARRHIIARSNMAILLGAITFLTISSFAVLGTGDHRQDLAIRMVHFRLIPQ
jgi:hypothetical protein